MTGCLGTLSAGGEVQKASSTALSVNQNRRRRSWRRFIGADALANDFYSYLRPSARKWKKSHEAERLLRQALDAQG